MQISENFTLKELTVSDYAVRHSIEEQWRVSDAVIQNLRKLAINVLEPIREVIKKPIIITSGYRCKRVNKGIGGALTSQHVEGKACDFKVVGLTIQEVFDIIKKSNINYDQLIQEFDSWIHISYNSALNRNENLLATKKGGKTQYKLV